MRIFGLLVANRKIAWAFTRMSIVTEQFCASSHEKWCRGVCYERDGILSLGRSLTNYYNKKHFRKKEVSTAHLLFEYFTLLFINQKTVKSYLKVNLVLEL